MSRKKSSTPPWFVATDEARTAASSNGTCEPKNHFNAARIALAMSAPITSSAIRWLDNPALGVGNRPSVGKLNPPVPDHPRNTQNEQKHTEQER
jgi:hypothetical protein